MAGKKPGKNNITDNNDCDQRLQGTLTLDLVALLAFTILAVSFLSTLENPLYKYVNFILIFSTFFLGNALIKRLDKVLPDREDDKNNNRDVRRLSKIGIRLIMISLLLIVVFNIIFTYAIAPNTVEIGMDLNIHRSPDNSYNISINQISNSSSISTISGLSPNQLFKLYNNCTIDNSNATSLHQSLSECLSSQSPLQRANNGEWWFYIIYGFDLLSFAAAISLLLYLIDELCPKLHSNIENVLIYIFAAIVITALFVIWTL